MTTSGALQIAFYLVVLLALAKPLGSYMARVYDGGRTLLHRILLPFELWICRRLGIRADDEMGWQSYAVAMLLFNALGLAAVYVLQRIQAWLPLNPAGLGPVATHTAFNTAASFASNTNWQSYGGETTMSYLTQMLAMTVQNFVSAATGMAVLVAFIRGIVRRTAGTIGSFWIDLTRTILYILLPLSFVLAIALVSQGVVQTFRPYQTAPFLQEVRDAENKPVAEQVLALGPAASQVAIKQLGTNGGGFFNVNSAHPFENPTPLSNMLESLAILLIPAALCYTFGKMVGDTRQGWAILAAMTIVFVGAVLPAAMQEQSSNPALVAAGVDQQASGDNPGGNIIILSVRGQEEDKIAALDAGADDYITKPFAAGELEARMRVAIRHASRQVDEPVFRVDDLTVDLPRRLVSVAGRSIDLTPTEYDLLKAFVAHAGKVLTHRQLLAQAWGPGYTQERHLLQVNISNLRRKLEPDPTRPRYIVTEPGVGYRLKAGNDVIGPPMDRHRES